MRNKNFKNIGNVAISEIALCDTTIGLYIPIENMSENIRREYEKSEKHFTETVNKEHPEIDLSQYTLYRDVALHMDLDNGKVKYSVAIRSSLHSRLRSLQPPMPPLLLAEICRYQR